MKGVPTENDITLALTSYISGKIVYYRALLSECIIPEDVAHTAIQELNAIKCIMHYVNDKDKKSHEKGLPIII